MHSEELKMAFDLDVHSEYEDLILFKGKNVGFSVKRPYPADLPYKPPVTKTGNPDTVALIRVAYNPDQDPTEKIDKKKVPIWIDINKHSKYRFHHFRYNHDDENCPTAESLAVSQKTPAPVDLESFGEYFLDHEKNSIVNKTGNSLHGHEILDQIFHDHCRTTGGMRRKGWKSIAILAYASEAGIKFFKCLFRIAFCKGFSETAIDLRPYQKHEIIALDAKPLVIFGYTASKNVIVTYALLVLGAYMVKHLTGWPPHQLFSGIWENPFLLLCLVLVTLPLLEHCGPLVLLWVLNRFIDLRYWSIRHSPLYRSQRKRSKDL
jgi:hypothetical protein